MAADYQSFLEVLNIPHEFPDDCIEVDYLYEGPHIYVTLRWRNNRESDWLKAEMLPLLVGEA